jgi:hypothetical protein
MSEPDDLQRPLELPEDSDDMPPPDDALAAVLLRVMDTDPESNIVFGSIPRGEAEDFAAAVTYAEFSGSPVILRYENMKNMAKRAEGGALLDKILGTVKAIGKAVSEPKAGFFNRFRGA